MAASFVGRTNVTGLQCVFETQTQVAHAVPIRLATLRNHDEIICSDRQKRVELPTGSLVKVEH